MKRLESRTDSVDGQGGAEYQYERFDTIDELKAYYGDEAKTEPIEHAKWDVSAEAEAYNAVSIFPGRHRPARAAFIRYIARRGNVTEEKAAEALAAVEDDTDRPFLDWLLNGGLEKLIEIVLKLLPLLL